MSISRSSQSQRSKRIGHLLAGLTAALVIGLVTLSSSSRLVAGAPQAQGQPASADSVQSAPAGQAMGISTRVLRAKGETVDSGAASGSDVMLAPGAPLPAWAQRKSSQAGSPTASTGLVINAIFDSTITTNPNAAAIMSTINAAMADYQSKAVDPITVTINFAAMSTGLGRSSTFFCNLSYSTYLASLKADATTGNDTTATSLLPSVSTNPVNDASTINVKTANQRAVGITSCSPSPGSPDGTISLNTLLTSPGSPGTTGAYNLMPVVEHEIDEVLGLGSALPTPPNSTIFPEDLFRYNSTGSRSITTSLVNAFFSINGTTLLAQFDNQNDGGDFGDWQSNPLPSGTSPRVQDAFATPGANPVLGVELTALDVIGYNTGVPAAPVITSNPADQTIPYGTAASLSVVASGTGLSYQWYHGTSGNTASPFVGATSSTYAPALISNTKFWARASNSSGHADSNTASVTVNFTDNALAAGTSLIKAVHVSQLRARIDAARFFYGARPAYSYTYPATAGTVLHALDITQMRTALLEAYSDAGMGAPTYSTSPALGGAIVVVDVADLRTKVKAIEQ